MASINDSSNNPYSHVTAPFPSAEFRPDISTTTRYRVSSNTAKQAAGDPSDGDDNFQHPNSSSPQSPFPLDDEVKPAPDHDRYNYAILIALYTLQGIPMGLSASIPFLIQRKMKAFAENAASAAIPAALAAAAGSGASSMTTTAAQAARLSYNANAIFALCSWPFSLKLLWAPVVDACFLRCFGRRKSWLVPVQLLAGLLMVGGANFVETQLGLGTNNHLVTESFNVKGVTIFFFVLYALMATQDIAVDGWALTMLSKKNRGRGPVCNSIGQNIGYFLSFVGFLALNDADSSESLWRPLFGLPSNPDTGLVSLGGFIRFMGYFMLITTTAVGLFKHETTTSTMTRMKRPVEQNLPPTSEVLLASDRLKKTDGNGDEEHELDASEIGLKETYHRLWAVCKLPAVQWLFLILFTYRLPTALGDNVKFLKAVELGLSKSTTALLSPTVILPLGILVPIVATKLWHGHPLRQFTTAFKLRVTLVPFLDLLMLSVLRRGKGTTSSASILFWSSIIASTALQAIVSSLQFNAQMTFFASRVDPAIGGSYMTLLNTAANLGGTWPASFIMWLTGKLTRDPECLVDMATGVETCTQGRDPYAVLQICFGVLGCLWIALLGNRVHRIAELPDDAWRTHLLDGTVDGDNVLNSNRTATNMYDPESGLTSVDVELAAANTKSTTRWERNESKRE